MNSLENLRNVLRDADQTVEVDPALGERALVPLRRMLNFSASRRK